jgi:DNA-binding MarR family transcriptional regulator
MRCPITLGAAYRVPAHLARRFHQICLRAVAEVIGPMGITRSEYAILVSIVDLPGLHQRRLATGLGIDPVSASQAIDPLEHMGLINRGVDPSDSRACVLTISRRVARL